MITRLMTGGALALLLAVPGATLAQAPTDTPPAAAAPTPVPTDTPPAAPAPVDAAPVNPTPSTAPETTAPPSPPPAPEPASKKRSRFRIGPEVGVYFLTSGKARSQFGSSSLSIGLGLGSISQASTRGRLALDLQVQYQTRNGNHMFLAPLGIAYRKALNQGGPNVVYVGATADLDFVDIRSGDYNVHSGVRTAFGASPLIGVSFGDSGFLEARYLYVSRVKGFDLSGLNVSAGFRF